jgi:hypothetical protein
MATDQPGDPSGKGKGDASDEYAIDDPLGLDQRSAPGAGPDEGLVIVPEARANDTSPQTKAEPPKPLDVEALYQPPPPPPQTARRKEEPSGFAEYFRLPDKRFSRPTFFRAIGRIAGCMGVGVLLGSLLLIAWKRTWFTGGILLILLFLVGESTAVILEALARLGDSLPRSAEKKDEKPQPD